MSIESQKLVERVEALERSDRVMKGIFTFLVAVVGCVLVLHHIGRVAPTATAVANSPSQVTRIIRAEELELVDNEGNCRARLGLTRKDYDENAPGLEFFTSDGKKVAELTGYGNKRVGDRTYFCNPGLRLEHPNGKHECTIDAQWMRMTGEVRGKRDVIQLSTWGSASGVVLERDGSRGRTYLRHFGLSFDGSRARSSLSPNGLSLEDIKSERRVSLTTLDGLEMSEAGKSSQSRLGVRIRAMGNGREFWLGAEGGLPRHLLIEPPERMGNRFYKLQIKDLAGTIVANGTLSLPIAVQSSKRFKGAWLVNMLQPANERTPAVQCLAENDGALSGTVARDRVSIDLHPGWADHNVLLDGRFDDDGIIKGQCSFWSFVGTDVFGSFEATPIVFESLADGP